MPPRYECFQKPGREGAKEHMEVRNFFFPQNGEPGKRLALGAVETRRDSPHTATASTQLVVILLIVFNDAIRRVRHDRVKSVRWQICQPSHGIGQNIRCET